METKNYYQKAETIIKELECKVQGLFSEILYMKLSIKEKNERSFMNSIGIGITRISEMTDQVQKVLSLSIDMLKEIKFPPEDLRVIKNQMDEANTRIIKLSNALTNTSYFIKQNIVNE